MKRNILFLSLFVLLFVACDNKQKVENQSSNKDIVGHWEQTDARDAQYQPVDLGYVDRLFIETDATWKSFRDDEQTGSGTYILGHTDEYVRDGNSYGAQDSIVFDNGKTKTVEYYIIDEGLLKFTGGPDVVGQPFKIWKRID